MGGGLFKKSESTAKQIADKIASQQDRCYLCEKIKDTFKRYMGTFFYLWGHEKEMPSLVESLPGFCLPHYGVMLEAAEKSLGKKQLEEFLNLVVPLQQKSLKKLADDMDWFIQKFDYRNTDAPWGDSKDAITKVMAALKGIVE